MTPYNYNRVTEAITDELARIVGEQLVLTDVEKMEPYSHDEVSEQEYSCMPEVVVKPKTAVEVSEIVRLANREKIPITPRGAGSGLSGGAVPVCGGIVLSMERMNQIISLIEEVWGKGQGETCLDVGCGSGVGSMALRRLGYSPLAYDNDPSQLALGLISGRLEPSETMCLDAAIASRYIGPAPYGVCLMAGTIDHTARWCWEPIIEQLLVISERILVTVGMEKESDFVKEWATGRGRVVEVVENDRDPFYDRWVCLIERSEDPDQ